MLLDLIASASPATAAIVKICYNFAPAIVLPLTVMAVFAILDRQ